MDERIDFVVKQPSKICQHCGNHNDVTDRYCRWCGKLLSPEEKSPKKPAKIKFKILCIALCAMLLLAVLSTSVCFHKWIEATCESPRHCSACNKTKGEALGHNWRDATCTVAQSCQTCFAVKGTPLGHTLTEENRQFDPVAGEYIVQQHCTLCDRWLDGSNIKLETFVQEDLFLFSAQDFLDRMSAIAKESYPNFHYEFATERDYFMVHLFLTNANAVDATLMFLTKNDEAISVDSISDPGIWCISLTDVGDAEEFGGVLSGDVLQLVYSCCDPLLREEDLTRFIAYKITSALNAAEGNSIFGYMEQNGLLYEFGHIIYEDIAIENIQIYAADWR